MCQEGSGGRRLVGQDTPSQSIRVYLALPKPVLRASRSQSAPPKPAKKAARHSCHGRAVSIPGLRGVETQPREVTRSVQGRKGSKGYYPGEKHSSPAQSLERKVKSGPCVMLKGQWGARPSRNSSLDTWQGGEWHRDSHSG